MKWFMLFLCIIFLTIPLFSQDTTKHELSAQEMQVLRDALKAVAGTDTAYTRPPEPHKSMADVLDKTLDISVKAFTTIVGYLEKAAPWVWKTMIRQQYATAIMRLVVPTGMLVLTLILVTLARKKILKPRQGYDSWTDSEWGMFSFRTVIPIIATTAFGLWFLERLSDSIALFINPEYYALKDLIQMVLHPGSL